MNHDKIINTLVQSLCAEGKRPPPEIEEHVSSCRVCMDTLAMISELIKPGSSQAWYGKIRDALLCEEIEMQLYRLVSLKPQALANQEPEFANHIKTCALCSERFVSAQNLLEAEQEGLFGPPIELPQIKTDVWKQIKEKVFQFGSEISAVIRDDAAGFSGIQCSVPGFEFTTEAVAVRSTTQSDSETNIQSGWITLDPPTSSDKLIFRLVNEGDGQITVELKLDGKSTERLVITLIDSQNENALLEARSISEDQPYVKFENIQVKNYEIEIRSNSGTSKIPLVLQREKK